VAGDYDVVSVYRTGTGRRDDAAPVSAQMMIWVLTVRR
jgi:hypothetical protein